MPSPLDEIMATRTLFNAYQVAKPHVGDTVGQISNGAALLALWMAKHGEWHDVSTPDRTLTLKRIKKDPYAARGSIACIRGDIVQISRDPSADNLWVGTMMDDNFSFVHYFAGGDTGELVEGDTARLCGVVTGIFSYPNVSGGETQAVQMVGMFDMNSRG